MPAHEGLQGTSPAGSRGSAAFPGVSALMPLPHLEHSLQTLWILGPRFLLGGHHCLPSHVVYVLSPSLNSKALSLGPRTEPGTGEERSRYLSGGGMDDQQAAGMNEGRGRRGRLVWGQGSACLGGRS